MRTANYQHHFTMPIPPAQVYEAITRVKDWWTINTEGRSLQPGDEFTVQFEDVHLTRQQIIEAVPGKRIVWKVIESHLPWLKDAEEWRGTKMVFEITATPEGSLLTFTHIGLTPGVECFDQCKKGWDYFLGQSLYELITEGTGMPDTSDRKHVDTIGHVSPQNA